MSKRYGTLEARFWRHVNPEPNTGCWLWDGPIDNWGYGRFRDGRRKVRAHRLSAFLHGKEIPWGMLCRHTCDVPACVNPDHLLPGTDADNKADAVRRGRHAKGERAPSAKLTAEQVGAIRRSPGTHRQIAQVYGVSHNVIGRIKRGQSWVGVNA